MQEPRAIAIDADDNIYFVGRSHCIRKIDIRKGLVSTVAGAKKQGYKDGKCFEALFSRPYGIAIDHYGDIIIADTSNHVVYNFF